MKSAARPLYRWFPWLAAALLLIGLPLLAQESPADSPAYRQFGAVSSRDLVWVVAQIKLMFAAFILGVPIFALIIEFIGWLKKDDQYDRLAKEFIKLSLIGFSATATLGAILLFFLITLYPKFWTYMSGVFGPTMWIYPVLFFFESFTLYIYWYGWEYMKGNRKKFHLMLGVLLNIFGTILVCLTNAWATFMMTPNGVNPETGALISVWEAVNNATWHPLNIHRLIANVVFGGAIAGAYAAYKFLVSKSEEDRAYYDWMGYIGNFVAVSVFLVLPFAGYWLGKEIYDHNQQMGITLMGGFLSWLWIIQAIMIAILFLSANFYLWTGMERIEGAERYRKYIKYMLFVLLVCVLVWSTPHSLVASLEEARKMGGTHHPLLGVLGVMSAKNTAVNLMILTTFLSFMLYRRGNLESAVSWRKTGMAIQWAMLAIAAIVVIYFGIRGYYVDAATRIGFAPKQVLMVLLAIVVFVCIDIPLFKNANEVGKIRWGKIPARSQFALFLLAITFCWLMGLMGYARSALRQHWHVYGIVRDTSRDAFLPTLGQASFRISLAVVLFIFLTSFVFWVGSLGSYSFKGGKSPITKTGLKVYAQLTLFMLVVVAGFVRFANAIPQVEHQPPADISPDQDVWSLERDALVNLGEQIFFGKGTCGVCHAIGEKGQRAPDLKGLSATAPTRNPDLTPGQYIIESMVDPGGYVVEGYGNIMPRIDKAPIGLSPQELYVLTAYLEGMDGGEITVTKEDVPGSDGSAVASAEPVEVAVIGDPTTGKEIFFGKGICWTCHQVGQEGQAVGPDLTEIAKINTLSYIQESVLEPSKVIVSGYEPVVMPPVFGTLLNAKEFNDLVAFLMTLKGE